MAQVELDTGSGVKWKGYGPAIAYVDQSVASLTVGQAAGTSTILAANSARKVLMVNPTSNCALTVASGATTGWPLFANIPNVIDHGVPASALYVYGLSAGAVLTIWEG